MREGVPAAGLIPAAEEVAQAAGGVAQAVGRVEPIEGWKPAGGRARAPVMVVEG